MESVSSTSSANQYGVQQFMRQRERRSADQAVQTAKSLRVRANDALRAAHGAGVKARVLSLLADQGQELPMDSTSSASAANKYGVKQLTRQVAKRSADQAIETVQSLKRKANDALLAANSAEEKARILAARSDQGRESIAVANQEPAATVQQAVMQLSNSGGQLRSHQQTPASTTRSASVAPVLNSQNQVTGTLINTTA